MRRIANLIKKQTKRFLEYLSKESLKRNLTILDEIKKGRFYICKYLLKTGGPT